MTLFKKRAAKDYILYSAIIAVGIILDQLTKYLTARFMTVGQSIPLIKGFLHLTYTTNDGMAFGTMDGEDQRWVFMVVSGGIGNMIDRLGIGFYVNPVTGNGEVIDFIDFCGIWNAVFNGADSFVCVGASLLVLALVLDIIKESKAEKAKKAEAADSENSAEDGEK